MAIVIGGGGLQVFALQGFSDPPAVAFYIGLLQGAWGGAAFPYVLTDISPYYADFKGYAEQAVTPSTLFSGGDENSTYTFTTANFAYDSGASGTSSNTINGWYLRANLGGTDYVCVTGDISPNWLVAADGDEPKVPLTITMAQRIPCP